MRWDSRLLIKRFAFFYYKLFLKENLILSHVPKNFRKLKSIFFFFSFTESTIALNKPQVNNFIKIFHYFWLTFDYSQKILKRCLNKKIPGKISFKKPGFLKRQILGKNKIFNKQKKVRIFFDQVFVGYFFDQFFKKYPTKTCPKNIREYQ